jgi:predicted Zn-dependent protease
MASSRLDTMRAMVEADPTNPLARFGLANELIKTEDYEGAITALNEYLAIHEDEGAAYRLLAQANEKLKRFDHAREAYRKGAEAATRHHHPGMAAEFEERLEDLDGL